MDWGWEMELLEEALASFVPAGAVAAAATVAGVLLLEVVEESEAFCKAELAEACRAEVRERNNSASPLMFNSALFIVEELLELDSDEAFSAGEGNGTGLWPGKASSIFT